MSLWTESDCLWAVGLKVLNPHAQGGTETEVREFGDQPTGDNSVNCITVIHKTHPHICPLLVKVDQ